MNIKEAFSRNWSIKLLSLLLSVFIWFFVLRVENPEIQRTIKNVPVKVTMEGSVPDGLGLSLLDDGTVYYINVTISGRASYVNAVTRSDILAQADLRSVVKAGEYSVPVVVSLPNDELTLVSQYPNSIKLAFDVFVTREVPVSILTRGSAAQGYVADTCTASPSSIFVTGPSAVVAGIDRAVVEVVYENNTEAKVADLPFILVDSSGNQVDSPYVSANVESVQVMAPVLKLASLPLSVNLLNNPVAGSKGIIEYAISPSSIDVAGQEDFVASLGSIPLGDFDLEGVVGTVEKTYQIVLPSGLVNVNSVKTATVRVTVPELGEKSVTVNGIRLVNLPEGAAGVSVKTKSLDVLLRGVAAQIDQISAANIDAYVDLGSQPMAPGQYQMEVKFSITGFDKVIAVGTYTAIVEVS